MQRDMEWAPIEGVTLERYAGLARQMSTAGILGPAAIEDWIAGRGVEPGSWARIAAGWSSRMARYPAVRRRFDDCQQTPTRGS